MFKRNERYVLTTRGLAICIESETLSKQKGVKPYSYKQGAPTKAQSDILDEAESLIDDSLAELWEVECHNEGIKLNTRRAAEILHIMYQRL